MPTPSPKIELEWIDRVFDEVVAPARLADERPVEIAAHHLTGEPVSAADALSAQFEPFEVGGAWGWQWGTTWFAIRGEVPEDWAGRRVVVRLHLGHGSENGFSPEGLVWIDGAPAHGIGRNHPDVVIAAEAVGGEAFAFHVEAAANPDAFADKTGLMLLAEPEGPSQLVLRECRLVLVEESIEALAWDWHVVRSLAELETPAGDRARYALSVAAHELEASTDASAVASARAALGEVLAHRGEPNRHHHLAVGNSHLDTAWVWPLRETRRKAARTFATACTMIERSSDYRFVASQAQHLAWIQEDHPALWARILGHVRTGRFEVVGNTWVEPDCNLPSGESLVRQIIHGRRFFREEMGVDAEGMWLPDTFGYSAALPQILGQAGIGWFVTQKLSWNEVNQFPHHTFFWEGIDGSRVLTHLPPSDTYAGMLDVESLRHGERRFAHHDVRSHSLYLYGHGDGGGGPDQGMLERARRLEDTDGVGRVTLTGATEALAVICDEGDPADLPVWVGELYLEKHRGTYTTHGATKRANRDLEELMRAAELWSWAAAAHGYAAVSATRLDAAWKTLLLHQFHDILPGTSIHWVHRETTEAHDALREEVASIVAGASTPLAECVERPGDGPAFFVTNSTGWRRDEVVEIDGHLSWLSAPPFGWQVNEVDRSVPASPVTVSGTSMENGVLRVEWDQQGLLTSVRHLESGRDAIADGQRANVLQLLDDEPADWDAWDIDADAFESVTELTDIDAMEVVEQSPLRSTLRVERSFGESRVVQHLRLSAGSGRLEIETDLRWHERHKLLKAAMATSVRASNARHEIQFGHVERPTHRNTSWDAARFETCAHTWVDLSDDDFGVALLNDGKYGHDVLGNVIRLSLVRAPIWPDPLADRGHHHFTYALFPHAGPPTSGGVIEAAHTLNSPLRVTPVPATTAGTLPPRRSLVEPLDPGAVVTAIKAADDGEGLVVRLHEAFGAPRRVRLRVRDQRRAARVDLLEADLGAELLMVDADGCTTLDLDPFELVTLRFTA